MNNRHKIVFFILILGLVGLLSGCTDFHYEAKELQRDIQKQQVHAMKLTDQLVRCLEQKPSIDSLLAITCQDRKVLFYIFDDHRMVYWSDNWLSSDEVVLYEYGRWTYRHYSNAHTINRWTRAGGFNILTVIPIKYDYPIENSQLENTFIKPFRCSEERDISRIQRENYAPIYDKDGNYLFSLTPTLLEKTKEINHLDIKSFSYSPLVGQNEPSSIWDNARARVQIYFVVTLALFILIIGLGIWGLVHSHGFRNMRLSVRLMYIVLGCVLVSYICIFAISIRYVQNSYQERQEQRLASNCRFIQSYLQSLYYWNVSLTPNMSAGLSVDLRDLSYNAEVDIHVYDNYGELIATSTPELFENGLLSRHITPAPFFAPNHSIIQQEKIGNLSYMAGYVPMLNGSFVQIGYISVPSFISAEERNREVDEYLAQLLPPYVVLLFVSLFIAYWAARLITAPMEKLTEKMRKFEIGKADNHIEYAGHDEVGELAERYNAMVDQVEDSASRLAKAEREGAWRTMARQIAHEINNPLTPMKLTIQQLQRTKGTERFDAYFDKATHMLIEQIDNLSRIAVSFSTFAKQPEVVSSEIDIAYKLTNVLTLLRNNPQGVPIRYVGPDHGMLVWADAEQIGQVFTNIIRNAIQAMDGQANADIIVILKDSLVEQGFVEISFSDNGPGIPEEIRSHVFVPNFTTKSTGMGLGLAISKHIVEGTGGKICFQTSEKGTTFFVYLKKKQ